MNKLQNKNGYSVIEIIIYLAIFTAISLLVINLFIVILSSFNTTNMNRTLLESGTISMERMSREIRQAKSIDVSSSSDTLILNSIDSFENTILVRFIKENEQLILDKNDSQDNLLGHNIFITNLVFNYINTTESQAVKIEMTLLYSDSKNIKSENFYNTVILRGGY